MFLQKYSTWPRFNVNPPRAACPIMRVLKLTIVPPAATMHVLAGEQAPDVLTTQGLPDAGLKARQAAAPAARADADADVVVRSEHCVAAVHVAAVLPLAAV